MRTPAGFTLLELLVALAIMTLILSLALPRYIGGITRAEEAALKQNLASMRDALDKHYADTGQYPSSLEDLVTKKYLRSVPDDPITQSQTTWVLVPPADPTQGGIFDVRSGAQGAGRNGRPYEQW